MADWNSILRNAAIGGLWLVGSFLVAHLFTRLIHLRHKRRPFVVGGLELDPSEWYAPLRILIPCVALRIVAPGLDLPAPAQLALQHVLDLLIIGSLAWIATRTVGMARLMIYNEYPVDMEDNLQARRVRTQVRIIARVLNVSVLVVAGAAMLMTFDQVRQFGVSLLASAGVAGIVLGFAAQKSIGTLLAGIQIAFTQPIRLDDVVIVEGEFGRIEEITLTYVVVKVWDQRRLVVPVTYFLDHTFQNWTRTSAQILGTVYLYADYTLPVEPLRQQLKRILDANELWDQRAWGLQVTGADAKTIELRALMSADDASEAWDLRCAVREQLIAFLQEQFPESLPRVRLEREPAAGQG